MADNPVAYFLTMRAYGTWLPGDARGAVRRSWNSYGSPTLPASGLEAQSRASLTGGPIQFDAPRRQAIAEAIREVCAIRGWGLLALNVRTNHVHLIVQCEVAPERAMNQFKSYATRRMVASGAFPANVRAWERHGSTRHLWDDTDVDEACGYVVYGQGPDL